MIDLKSYVETLAGKPVAVFGLGLSGISCIRALSAAGAAVYAWDDDISRHETARKAGAVLKSFEALDGYAFLVLSPGIALHYPVPHPVAEKARSAGVEIIGDIELLHRSGHGLKTIGITGTNGKSTTTALISHILNRSGRKVVTGGNIGIPVMNLDLSRAEAIVLELSSYQLDLCPSFAPDIAVHLNLTPDHLDRHGDLQGYIDAKMRIFRGAGDAVIGIDDEPSRDMMNQLQKADQRNIHAISVTGSVRHGVYVNSGILHDAMQGKDDPVGILSAFPGLQGVHNHQNAAAAYGVCHLLGIRPTTILAGMESFPGLPHRLFTVRTINGIAYVNDSKATNADAAARALACYRNIYWILGGRPKAGGLGGLEQFMHRVRQAFVIGEAAGEFAAWLQNHGIPSNNCGTLDRAVAEAHRLAQSERGQPGGAGVVLLSPACASFDQFRSFEHRGTAFSDIVLALPEQEMKEVS